MQTSTALKPRHRDQIGSFTFRITEDNKPIFDEVRAICQKNNWTLSSAIGVALSEWVTKNRGRK